MEIDEIRSNIAMPQAFRGLNCMESRCARRQAPIHLEESLREDPLHFVALGHRLAKTFNLEIRLVPVGILAPRASEKPLTTRLRCLKPIKRSIDILYEKH